MFVFFFIFLYVKVLQLDHFPKLLEFVPSKGRRAIALKLLKSFLAGKSVVEDPARCLLFIWRDGDAVYNLPYNLPYDIFVESHCMLSVWIDCCSSCLL
jgi:hypothetical protein